MPEGFQNGEKGDAAQQAVSELETAHSELDELLSSWEEFTDGVEDKLAEIVGNLETARDG